MNQKDKAVTVSTPARIAIPDGKGGYTYDELEVIDLRQPRVLPSVNGTRRGIVAAPDQAPLQMKWPPKKQP